ncbi:hypothetical protein PF002_g33035 [Phytophthora fragariae]|uniref:Uncharacterized protein n=1 Tax=Phytophthora fragariae TaxID=53985 RepID=A0A6A3V4W6_9STRA|nr:hypothetical protein PF002_g33035 [Phytophthora fragariae]
MSQEWLMPGVICSVAGELVRSDPLSRLRDAWPDWPSSIASLRCKKQSLCDRLKARFALFIKIPSTRSKLELPV